jgi:hypothetical protein
MHPYLLTMQSMDAETAALKQSLECLISTVNSEDEALMAFREVRTDRLSLPYMEDCHAACVQ